MQSKNLVIVLIVVLLVGGFVYHQQHTKTASIELPGGKSIGITTHD